MSDIKEEMLSVDWPLESRDDGAGGGGPRGLWIPPVNIRPEILLVTNVHSEQWKVWQYVLNDN